MLARSNISKVQLFLHCSDFLHKQHIGILQNIVLQISRILMLTSKLYFSIGLVFHFMFSKGFHPFHSKTVSLLDTLTRDEFQPHTLEWSIFKNEVQVHHSLGDEQIHLVNMLLRNDPKQRPCSDGLLKTHCYFWSNLKKREFICKVGEQPEVAAPQKCPSSNFENNVNGSTFGKQFRAVSGWNTAISDVLYREISRRRAYDTSSVTGRF